MVTPISPALAAHGLVKRFGDRVVVDGFDLVVMPGQVAAVVGPPGSGKTTVLRMLGGLLRPDGGVVRVGAVDIWRDPAYAVGFVAAVLEPSVAAVEEALGGGPRVLVVDDPDPELARLVRSAGLAAVLSGHDRDALAPLCDVVVDL